MIKAYNVEIPEKQVTRKGATADVFDFLASGQRTAELEIGTRKACSVHTTYRQVLVRNNLLDKIQVVARNNRLFLVRK